jgi:hypothetical protein
VNLQKLKRLALAATQGPWTRLKDGKPGIGARENYIESKDALITYGRLSDADATYIAAANPVVILELVAEIEKLQAQITATKQNDAKSAQKLIETHKHDTDGMCDESCESLLTWRPPKNR